MAKWFLIRRGGNFSEDAARYGIDPVTARLLRNRGLEGPEVIEEYLHGSFEMLHSPMLLGGMEQAVSLIREEAAGGGHIRIIGDYDVDGVCASFILQRAIQVYCDQIVQNQNIVVDSVIPHRIRDGYGLNRRLIEEAIRDGVDLLITCDNGIAAAAEIAMAKEAGIRVIVTDHHEIPFEETEEGKKYLLPAADVIVDPKQEGDAYPYPGICGAVVAYKLICALFDFSQRPEKGGLQEELFGLCALATVCDVMELTGENRIIVKEGLKCLSETPNIGMQALIEVTGLKGKPLSYYHAGFVLGPCINACGRLDSADRVLKLLHAENAQAALVIAGECKALNDTRKEYTEEGLVKARELIEGASAGGDGLDSVLVVFLPDCHESVAGIIAGRLREQYHRPAFVLTSSVDGVKGSGRSIEAFHMYEHMTGCRELFTKFGGHAGAAGLSMKEQDIDLFRQRINADCGLTAEDFEERLNIDMEMPLGYADLRLAKELLCLEPCGNGNPRPLFAKRGLRFERGTLIGKNRNMARFFVADQGVRREMLLFKELDRFAGFIEKKYGEGAFDRLMRGEEPQEVNAVFTMQINAYKGNESLELVLEDYC